MRTNLPPMFALGRSRQETLLRMVVVYLCCMHSHDLHVNACIVLWFWIWRLLYMLYHHFTMEAQRRYYSFSIPVFKTLSIHFGVHLEIPLLLPCLPHGEGPWEGWTCSFWRNWHSDSRCKILDFNSWGD